MMKYWQILIILFCSTTCYADFTAYMVGNSLTWDAKPTAIPSLGSAEGQTVQTGYHVKCGSSLNNIWSFPEATCVGPNSFGTFTGALQNNTWTAVSFQPYPRTTAPQSTLATDQQVINDMMDLALLNPANQDTKYFIYTGWPNAVNPYENQWVLPVVDADGTLTTSVRSYFDHLLDRVRADRPQLANQIFVLDAGEVMYEVNEDLLAGELEGYTDVHDLYRDTLHLNVSGQFMASVGAYTSFSNSEYTAGVPSVYGAVDPDFATYVKPKVYEVLSSNPTRTGVFLPGDMNGDGFQTSEDVGAFVLALTDRAAYESLYPLVNPLYPGDLNGDNLFDFGDAGPFKNLFGASAIAVPEPSSILLSLIVAISGLTIAGRRRKR